MAFQDSLEHLLQELDLLSCPVCFEEFEKDGDHIPRLLPCTHTLCETCVKQLIRDNRLECPECRTEHGGEDKEKSFPQNKYLLMHIMRKSMNGKLDRKEKKLCEEHRQELFLFCNEPECKKPICLVCLRKSHNKHAVMDIMDDKTKILEKKISYIERNLREKVIIFNAAKTEVCRKTEDCLSDLKRRRGETTNQIDDEFDKMKEEVNGKMRETSSLLDKEIATLEENLTLLSNMKRNTEDTKDNRDGGFSDLMDTIETVKETVM